MLFLALIWEMEGRIKRVGHGVPAERHQHEDEPMTFGAADERRTTVPCPRTGLDVEVVTKRRDGETDADLAERHMQGVEAQIEACKNP